MHDIVKAAPLFEGLGEEDLERLDDIARHQQLGHSEYLFMLGSNADRVYVVLEGSIDLCFPLSIGGALKDMAVQTIRPGDTLGWSAMVKPYRFTLSARAAEDTKLVGFRRRDLLELFEAEPRIGYRVMLQIAELVGHRLLRMEAMWAREFQRALQDSQEPQGAGKPPQSPAPTG